MKYINLFETQAAYDAAEKYYPNVSYIEATDTVVYQETDPGPDYSKEYLTFEALQNGTFTLTVPAAVNSTYMTSVSYSIDNGETWVDTIIDNTAQTITTPTIAQGDKVLWKGVGSTMALGGLFNHCGFLSTGNFNLSGNIMSLLYGDDFENRITFPTGSENTFRALFGIRSKVINADNLILPATTLTIGCYYEMFQSCISLTKAPELPATTLVDYCYYNMFGGCTSLTTAPALNATTLTISCYYEMFQDCTFLNNIKMLATDISATNCLSRWVNGVASTGTFTKAASMTTLPTGASGIPSGWTVVEIN